MASSIIHYTIANELIKRHSFKDPGRLLLGSVLVDYGYQGNSHLKIPVAGGHKRTYDFEGFRERYGELMKTDDMYLGYYLHLVQDILFRHFLFDRYHWDPTVPGNVEKLNRDYSIGNAYVVHRYELKDEIVLPDGFEGEAINGLCAFDLSRLKTSMDSYFTAADDGDIFFFTKEMTDEFIAEAVEFCMKEIDDLSCGKGGADSYELAWDNLPRSLLETTLNTRDLGGYRIAGTKNYTKYNRIYRSDLAKAPSDKDIAFLKSKGITTHIDFRIEKEVAMGANGFCGIDGFTYYNYPNVEGSYFPASVDEVPHSYQVIAEDESVTSVMRTIANAPSGVMYNCSAGKDRTGTVTAMLLWLCGVSEEDIVYDYMITKVTNEDRFRRIRENYPELDMNIVIPNADNMRAFLRLMKDKYGTAQAYFSAMGITAEEQQRIVEKLTK